jgi:hypothetical protein
MATIFVQTGQMFQFSDYFTHGTVGEISGFLKVAGEKCFPFSGLI